jgi:hypothetical protein
MRPEMWLGHVFDTARIRGHKGIIQECGCHGFRTGRAVNGEMAYSREFIEKAVGKALGDQPTVDRG